MSPALASIPPVQFKAFLEAYGYKLEKETKYNWTLFKKDSSQPVIVLPKRGKLVSLTIMMGILDQLKIDNAGYFGLLAQAKAILAASSN